MAKHILAVAAIICSSALAVAGTRAPKSAPQVEPCDHNFELSVEVRPAEGADNWPVGFKMSYASQAGEGQISRTQSDGAKTFDQQACKNWSKHNWAMLDQIMWEGMRPERKSMVCRNIASIHYKLDSKSQSASICLGASSQDTVASNFKHFYASSDGMVR